MTTTVAPHTARRPLSALIRPVARRAVASLNTYAIVVLDSLESTRAAEAAQTPQARRAVLDRFDATTPRPSA